MIEAVETFDGTELLAKYKFGNVANRQLSLDRIDREDDATTVRTVLPRQKPVFDARAVGDSRRSRDKGENF